MAQAGWFLSLTRRQELAPVTPLPRPFLNAISLILADCVFLFGIFGLQMNFPQLPAPFYQYDRSLNLGSIGASLAECFRISTFGASQFHPKQLLSMRIPMTVEERFSLPVTSFKRVLKNSPGKDIKRYEVTAHPDH